MSFYWGLAIGVAAVGGTAACVASSTKNHRFVWAEDAAVKPGVQRTLLEWLLRCFSTGKEANKAVAKRGGKALHKAAKKTSEALHWVTENTQDGLTIAHKCLTRRVGVKHHRDHKHTHHKVKAEEKEPESAEQDTPADDKIDMEALLNP